VFTREDLINYLSDIELTETNMRDIYTEALKYIDDPMIIKSFNFLVEAEEKHKNMVSNLKKQVIGLSITKDEE
jgi:rubrerythrin